MEKSFQYVKDIVTRLDRLIVENPTHEIIDRRILERDSLSEILDYVAEQRARNMPVDPDLGDVSGLPKELLAELNLSTPSELEQRIVAIIKSADKQKANINTILVELYNRHGIIQKRRNMQNKLWRMMDGKLIWGVDGEKGVYQSEKPSASTNPFKDLDTVGVEASFDSLDDDDDGPISF